MAWTVANLRALIHQVGVGLGDGVDEVERPPFRHPL